MRRILLALALVISTIVMGQKIADPKPFANSISAEDLKKYLYIIAGPEMEGRGTTTEGQRRAAAFIESQFKSFGLQPGNSGNYQLSYPVFQDSLLNASIEVNGQKFEINKDFSVNMPNNHNASLLGGEVVFAGYGISDSTRNDFAGVDAHGKIVLLFPEPPAARNGGTSARTTPRFNPMALWEGAQRNGAIAILQVQNNFPRKGGFYKGSQYLNGFRKTIYPNLFIISEQVAKAIMGADFDAAQEAVKNGNPHAKVYQADVKLDFTKGIDIQHGSNVIGYIEGTDKKDEYVFITAHYDHLGKKDSVIYYGADDDGSGTVSVMELAKTFAKAKAAGKGPRRTMVFMTVSGEEKGLWGSEYYSDHPLFALDKTSVDLNIDMIGRIDPKRKATDSTNYVYVVGDDKLSSDLRPISETVNNKYTKLDLDYKYNAPNDPERIYYRSDHFNFARKGVPIIFYFNGTHNDYHRPSDTPDKINYDLMAKRAQLVFYTAWEMANRNDMLKRDIPLTLP